MILLTLVSAGEYTYFVGFTGAIEIVLLTYLLTLLTCASLRRLLKIDYARSAVRKMSSG